MLHGLDRTCRGATERDGNLSPFPILVCLAARQVHQQAVFDKVKVTHIEPNQLGASECGCKANKNQRPITQALNRSLTADRHF